MGWLTNCDVCWETTRHACSDNDSKAECNRQVLRCPLASKADKLSAMQALGFDTEWIEDDE